MKVWDWEGREAAQGGQSRGENHQPHQTKSRSCICEALEAFRTPVPHSTCSEPPVGWAPPSRGRTLSRRGNSLTKRKTSTFTTSLLALQTFSILLVSKNQAWYLLFLELLSSLIYLFAFISMIASLQLSVVCS